MLRVSHRAVWHIRGMLLWLLQRPYLRFAPFPYPSVNTVNQWCLQSEQMVASKALPRRHAERALRKKTFTQGNLSELTWFRNRLGLKLAFMEDPLLVGMMAAKQLKGAASTMKKAAVEDAKKAAEEAQKAGQVEEAVRAMVGPRGGLPALKGDLLRLAALLQIDVSDPKLTVAQLKDKCRDVIKDIKFGASSSSASLATSPVRKKAEVPQGQLESPPRQLASPGSVASSGVSMEELQGLLAQQEQKYQSMLNQVFTHMTQMQANQFQVAANPQFFDMAAGSTRSEVDQKMEELSHEEIQKINNEYYQERMEERAMCQYGHTNLTKQQWEAIGEEL